MKRKTGKIIFALLMLVAGSQAYSVMFAQHDHNSSNEIIDHAGPVDQYGCHDSPTGYHCHR